MIKETLVLLILTALTIINILVPISGSSTVTPILALITDPHIAIGLASFYFFLTSTVRIFFFRKYIKWKYVNKLLWISLIGAILGSLALVKINPKILLLIVLLFVIYFLYKTIRNKFIKEKKKPVKRLASSIVGAFSGFLQGTGLAGSDLRNGYLYAENLKLQEVHGTTAVVGAVNFFSATLVRLATNQITTPNLIPLLYVFPFIILGTFLGKKILLRINKKYVDLIIITTMIFIIMALSLKILGM